MDASRHRPRGTPGRSFRARESAWVVTEASTRFFSRSLSASREFVPGADLPPLVVDHPEMHAQVGGKLRDLELGAVERQVVRDTGEGDELVGDRLEGRPHRHRGRRRAASRRPTSRRSGAGTRCRTGSGLGRERISSVTSSSRIPGTSRSNPRACRRFSTGERHRGGDPVGALRADVSEGVAQRQGDVALHPGVGEVGGDRLGDSLVGGQQILLGEGEQVRRLVALLLPPGVEVRAGDDRGGDPFVVEAEQLLVGDQQITATGLRLELLELR